VVKTETERARFYINTLEEFRVYFDEETIIAAEATFENLLKWWGEKLACRI
jgi:hypothetical protein